MKNTKRYMAIGLALAIGITGVGCAKKEAPKSEGTAAKPVATQPVVESKNPYDSEIQALRTKINYVKKDEAGLLNADEQVKVIGQMRELIKKGSDSKTIFTAFEKDITHLSPENADAFATAAMAGLRKNSFNDYKPYEAFFGDASTTSAKQAAFFDGAKAYGYNYFDLKQHPEAVKDESVKAQLANAASQGYLLVSSEGMVYPIVDYVALAKYKAYFTPDFAAVMDQQAFSVIDILVSDAALIVPIDHIAALVLEADQQIADAKDPKYKKYLVMIYTDYMRMLFFGTDNTPMYDYDSGKLREEVATLYKKLAGITGTKTADYVAMQMKILEASNGKYDEKVTKQINELLEKVYQDHEVTESDKNVYYSWMSGEAY